MASEHMKLLFPYNQAGKPQGLNNGGVETFMGSPYSSMARELGQNSIDARSNDHDPVIMHFKRLELPVSEIPNLDDFKRLTEICLATSIERKNPKEEAFFTNAKAILNQQIISVLEVSDFNTKGASQRGFEALTGEGETEKDDIDSGGSYGIGKSAGFAVSDLRTVFYSTRHAQGDRIQGITLFRSHKDKTYPNNENRLAKGYWGTNYQPIRNLSEVPAWMRREKTGTSVFALGMRPAKEVVEKAAVAKEDAWAVETITDLTINSFAAIYEKKVQFHLNNKRLDGSSLQQILDSDVIKALPER